MKYGFLVASLVCFVFSCSMHRDSHQHSSGAPSVTSAQTSPEPSYSKAYVLDVDVVLTDSIGALQLPPYCGFMLFNLSLNYSIVQVHSGIVTDSTIRINHQCPRELIEFGAITNDSVYRMRLRPRTSVEKRFINGKLEEVPLTDYEQVGN